jgi:hypothetical protein
LFVSLSVSCGAIDHREHCGPAQADSGGQSCTKDTDCLCDNQVCLESTCYVLCNTDAECTAAAAGSSKYCDMLSDGQTACYTVPH